MNSNLQDATQNKIDEIRAGKHWLNGVEICVILSDKDHNEYSSTSYSPELIDEITSAWINVAKTGFPPIGTFLYIDDNPVSIFQYDIRQDTDLLHTVLVVWCT